MKQNKLPFMNYVQDSHIDVRCEEKKLVIREAFFHVVAVCELHNL
jgi:hypothetical protein